MKNESTTIKWYFYRICDGSGDRPICQYMRLDYLLQLLETGKYFLRRRRNFIDSGERHIKYKFDLGITAIDEGIPLPSRESKRTRENVISYTDIVNCPTSCWTKADHESFLMWKSYASEIGVCVKTTVYKVISSLLIDLGKKPNENRLLCGTMNYYKEKNLIAEERQLFGKNLVYADEDEFRFYFHLVFDTDKKTEGVYVPVDTNLMINEVLLSPFICKDTAESLAEMIQRHYKIDANPSRIDINL